MPVSAKYSVEDDAYFLTVLNYIYQNPVQARISQTDTDYRWSSRHLLGKGNGLVDEDALFSIVSEDIIVSRDARPVVELEAANKRGAKARVSDEAAIELMVFYYWACY